jgi:hypothetical protein
MPTAITDAPLKITLTNVPDVRLAQLTRELERDLSRAGIRAQSIELLPVPGERGEPVTLGVLALALITHGAVTALIECFKAYLSRERTLAIKLTRPDGTQVEVTAHNVDTPAVRVALEAAAAKSE